MVGVTVRQKRPRGPYYIFIHHNGVKRSKKVGDRLAAEAVAKKVRERLAKGDASILAKKKLPAETLRAYAESWLEEYARGGCKKSTYENYMSIIAKHLQPTLGSKHIALISKEDVKELVIAKLGEDLDPKTVRNIKLCLSSILSTAEEDGLIAANPAVNLGRKIARLLKSRKAQKNVDFLTQHETRVFLDKVKEVFPRLHAFFMIACRAGLRLGELIALRPGDINFDKGFILVDEAIVRGELTTPKNGVVRRVDMSRQLAHVIRLHLEETERETKARGWDTRPEWLFFNEVGEHLDPDNLRSRYFYTILYEAGIRHIRIHDLRHTFASSLIDKGESLAYVSQQMGHASIVITHDTYGHLQPNTNRAAVDKLDDPGWNATADEAAAPREENGHGNALTGLTAEAPAKEREAQTPGEWENLPDNVIHVRFQSRSQG
ncbi:MAG: site-specific integrase [Syntrophorhabdales bacterium]